MDRTNHASTSSFKVILPLQATAGIVHGIFRKFDFKQLVGSCNFFNLCALVDAHIGLQNFVLLFALPVDCNETSGLRMSQSNHVSPVDIIVLEYNLLLLAKGDDSPLFEVLTYI